MHALYDALYNTLLNSVLYSPYIFLRDVFSPPKKMKKNPLIIVSTEFSPLPRPKSWGGGGGG